MYILTLTRPLSTKELVEEFLICCLELDREFTRKKLNQIINDVLTQQLLLATGGKPTLTHKDNRNEEYRDHRKRENLRNKILNELHTLNRLDNDEKIKLGKGGALPKTSKVFGKQAYFIIGLPASGKSSIVNKIADHYGAVVIDSDYAMRKLPEYDGSPGGANLVHDESSSITYKGADSLFGMCVKNGCNLVIPKIGNKIDSLRELRVSLLSAGYTVHLTLVELDRVHATIRAFQRFKNTKRYVPLSLIFDEYANDPIMVYYKYKLEWVTSGAVSTLGALPKKIESSDPMNPAELFT